MRLKKLMHYEDRHGCPIWTELGTNETTDGHKSNSAGRYGTEVINVAWNERGNKSNELDTKRKQDKKKIRKEVDLRDSKRSISTREGME